MKKIILSLTLLPVFIHADGEFVIQNAKTEQPPLTPFIEYHNRMAVFGPLHQVYERIKPDAVYAGVETWLLGAYNSKNKNFSGLAETEFRMGYNLFYNGKCHVTPFGGVGAIENVKNNYYDINWGSWGTRRHKHHVSLPAVAYGVLGVLYDHAFNSVVNLGVNVKGMIGGGVDKKHSDWGNPVLGFDVSVPLTFRFGHKRHWDYRFEPFDIYLHGKNVNINYFGFRNTLGYRF